MLEDGGDPYTVDFAHPAFLEARTRREHQDVPASVTAAWGEPGNNAILIVEGAVNVGVKPDDKTWHVRLKHYGFEATGPPTRVDDSSEVVITAVARTMLLAQAWYKAVYSAWRASALQFKPRKGRKMGGPATSEVGGRVIYYPAQALVVQPCLHVPCANFHRRLPVSMENWV